MHADVCFTPPLQGRKNNISDIQPLMVPHIPDSKDAGDGDVSQ